MLLLIHVIVFLLGLSIVLVTLFSAIKQTVLPGRKRVRLTRFLFRNTFRLFRIFIIRIPSEEARDAIMAFYAPISVMLLPFTWIVLIIIGLTALFWGEGNSSPGTALILSGAAITTEGFLAPKGSFQTTIYVCAGVIGLGLVGLLITFLPTIYTIYSQREEVVTQVAFCFGSPPSGATMLEQTYRLGLVGELNEFWHSWEVWFADMSETHISNIEVIFYRSPQPDTSWITAAGAILDACALFSSTVDRQDDPWLQLCFQAGCRVLGDIAADVGLSLPGIRHIPVDSLHVTRAEYDAVYAQLEQARVPLKQDREESWNTFVAMRKRYDFVLLALASLVFAPKAPWSSDRVIDTLHKK